MAYLDDKLPYKSYTTLVTNEIPSHVIRAYINGFTYRHNPDMGISVSMMGWYHYVLGVCMRNR